MKKYLIFIISFLLLFTLLQISTGLFLTAIYTPDFSESLGMGNTLSKEVVFVQNSQMPTLIIAVLSATLAYFILNKVVKKN
ncbi:hypothetical protein [Peribacillus sp. NPDC096540]|uniref:hypothetical protein n=1 Tax=Peribacillus sp. NPDC096540 TaxID=3390612 RepID=UPI003CFDEF2C